MSDKELIARLEADLSAQIELSDKFETKCEDLQRQIDELTELLRVSRIERDEYYSEKMCIETQAETLQAQLTEARERVKKLEHSIRHAEVRIATRNIKGDKWLEDDLMHIFEQALNTDKGKDDVCG